MPRAIRSAVPEERNAQDIRHSTFDLPFQRLTTGPYSQGPICGPIHSLSSSPQPVGPPLQIGNVSLASAMARHWPTTKFPSSPSCSDLLGIAGCYSSSILFFSSCRLVSPSRQASASFFPFSDFHFQLLTPSCRSYSPIASPQVSMTQHHGSPVRVPPRLRTPPVLVSAAISLLFILL